MADVSLGAQRLSEAIRPRMKGSELARRLGVTQQAVNAWLVGDAKPTPENMLKLEELLGIPMQAWVSPGRSATGTEG